MDHVFITGRRKDALDAAAAEIGKNVTAVQGDVASLAILTGSMKPSGSRIARLTYSLRTPAFHSRSRLGRR